MEDKLPKVIQEELNEKLNKIELEYEEKRKKLDEIINKIKQNPITQKSIEYEYGIDDYPKWAKDNLENEYNSRISCLKSEYYNRESELRKKLLDLQEQSKVDRNDAIAYLSTHDYHCDFGWSDDNTREWMINNWLDDKKNKLKYFIEENKEELEKYGINY